MSTRTIHPNAIRPVVKVISHHTPTPSTKPSSREISRASRSPWTDVSGALTSPKNRVSKADLKPASFVRPAGRGVANAIAFGGSNIPRGGYKGRRFGALTVTKAVN